MIPDQRSAAGAETSRILLCSGKVYYELLEFREEQKRQDVAILRVEQLYPFADATLQAAMEPYREGTPAFWVQEEPANMGAWPYLTLRFGGACRIAFRSVASPDPNRRYRLPAPRPSTSGSSIK